MRAGPAANVRVPSTKTPICSAYSPRTDGSRLIEPRRTAVTPAWLRSDRARSWTTRRSISDAGVTSSVASSGISALTLTSWENEPTSSVITTSTTPGPAMSRSSCIENPSRLAASR